MDALSISQSPFAIVTFIVAPAMLTNASSVLAMSTINRMLRARERMSQLFAESEEPSKRGDDGALLLEQVQRVERQAQLLLRALRAIYVALGAFAAATLVTLFAALVEQAHLAGWYETLTLVGLVLGATGVGGIVIGTANLFHATRLSLANIREEAGLIRRRVAAMQATISR